MDTNSVNLSIIVPALNEQDLIMGTYLEIISATSGLKNYEMENTLHRFQKTI